MMTKLPYMGHNEFPPDPEDFSTTDLNTAAYLKAKDVKLVRTEREGNRLRFHFPAGSDYMALEYLNSPERNFADALRNLKAATYHF